MRIRISFSLLGFVLAALVSTAGKAAEPAAPFELKSGDRVVFLGDTLIEREQAQGWIELMLTSRFPDRDVTFRNLGWSGDTPAGDSRFGLSLLQAGHEPADEGWKQLAKQIEEAKASVVFIGYGMASSFEDEAGLAKFAADYGRLLTVIERVQPGVRLDLLSPLPHETLGAPWPNPATRNAQLASYARAVGQIAAEHHARFISLYDLLQARTSSTSHLTDNGIHLTSEGYRALAENLEEQLFGVGQSGAWRTSTHAEPLRQAIVRKNEWFFHRSRPANMAYIFGFRKREQGRNATEVLQFDDLIAAEEKRIAQLRTLRPVDVPEMPLRIGNLNAPVTPQPQPEFVVADGFAVTLWAENPLLDKPVQMNFDPQGRLWVASSELYPQIEPGQAPTDKIILLEDTTGAGRADKATVFAEGLLIPTGLEVGDGGVYVAQSTELLHFKDTNGDGKADVRRTVLSGFGTEDTHHNLHTLRWGPDGRLYMNQSVYTRTDTETPHGVVRLKAGGVFRFDPRDEKMEVLYRGWLNAWGHQFDDFGQSFVTDGAGNRGISWAIPGATYQTLAPARRELQSISPGNYPKFCSIEILRSPLFPADWQGNVITCDFRAHRVVRFKLSDQGAGFVSEELPDVIRTTADTFRPIDARIGPDGALYIADWSNPIIQHGEVDFRDPRRDKAHGRIWRIAPKSATPLPKVNLTTLANRELLNRLTSPSGYDQEQARRVLVERGATAVLPDLNTWVAAQPKPNEAARLRALWMYEAFNHDEPALRRDLLTARDPRVRAAAVRAMPATGMLDELGVAVADENPRVRVEAIRALGSRHTVGAADLALSALPRPMDPFLDYALWLTMNELAQPWLDAVKSGAWSIKGRETQLEFGLKAVEPALAGAVLGELIAKNGIPAEGSGPWIELIGASGGPAELRVLFDQLLRGAWSEPVTARGLRALSDAARLRSARPAGELDAVGRLFESPGAAIRVAALQLASSWQLKTLAPRIIPLAGDKARTPAERTAAFDVLRSMGGPDAIAGLKSLTGPASAPEVRREALVTLASLDAAATVPGIIELLQSTTDDAEAQSLWRSLLSIQGMSGRLATELPKANVSQAIARAGLRPAREGQQHQALVTVLLNKAGLAVSSAPLTPVQLQALATEALAKGDPARGELVYRRTELACAVCHSIGGVGGKLGPDLTSIGASAPTDYLVESLLFPNAKIKEGYHSVLITTKDSRELNGMITHETSTEVTLRDSGNTVTSIPTNVIVSRSSVGSLMPAGLLDALLPEERLDLIKFLSQLGKPGPYDAAMGGVARVWKIYGVDSRNEHLGAQRVTQGDFGLADWISVNSLVDGTLPAAAIAAADKDRGSVRGLFVATRFESQKGGPTEFTLSGESPNAWINGKPVAPGSRFTADAKAGANTLILQIPQDQPVSALKLTASGVSFSLE
ncbi:MAG: PVC-type heme-binding CxxCH protein [Opitutus sp.]